MTIVICPIKDCTLNFDGKCSCLQVDLDTSPKITPMLICRNMRKK